MERIDQWPRVHTCVYDWCPSKRDECERCDRLVAILRSHRPRLPVKCDDEVTAAQSSAIDKLVAPEFATGNWETVEDERAALSAADGTGK